jgi:hypothetical protein
MRGWSGGTNSPLLGWEGLIGRERTMMSSTRVSTPDRFPDDNGNWHVCRFLEHFDNLRWLLLDNNFWLLIVCCFFRQVRGGLSGWWRRKEIAGCLPDDSFRAICG